MKSYVYCDKHDHHWDRKERSACPKCEDEAAEDEAKAHDPQSWPPSIIERLEFHAAHIRKYGVAAAGIEQDLDRAAGEFRETRQLAWELNRRLVLGPFAEQVQDPA